jgi:hypothetical protein
VNTNESDDAFLQELISRIQPWTGKWITTSRGTLRVDNEDEIRLFDIAQRRGKMAKAILDEMIARNPPPRQHADSLAMMSDSKVFAVRCKTGDCGAKIPLLSEVRSVFRTRESTTSLLCPIGHRHQYTEADVRETSGTNQTSGEN